MGAPSGTQPIHVDRCIYVVSVQLPYLPPDIETGVRALSCPYVLDIQQEAEHLYLRSIVCGVCSTRRFKETVLFVDNINVLPVNTGTVK